MAFDLSNYVPVAELIGKFWADWPKGRLVTTLIDAPDGQWLFRCEVYRDAADTLPSAVGHAHEVIGSSPVNKTSALENCETSSAGRALRLLGYGSHEPSREELAKAERTGDSRRGSTKAANERAVGDAVLPSSESSAVDVARGIVNEGIQQTLKDRLFWLINQGADGITQEWKAAGLPLIAKMTEDQLPKAEAFLQEHEALYEPF